MIKILKRLGRYLAWPAVTFVLIVLASVNLTNIVINTRNNLAHKDELTIRYQAPPLAISGTATQFAGQKLTLSHNDMLIHRLPRDNIDINSISLRFRLSKEAMFFLIFRMNGDDFYSLRLTSGHILPTAFLKYRQEQLVKKQPLDITIEPKQWHNLSLILNGPRFTLYIDNALIDHIHDSDYPTGTVAFASGASKVRVDDINVIGTHALTGKRYIYNEDFSPKRLWKRLFLPYLRNILIGLSILNLVIFLLLWAMCGRAFFGAYKMVLKNSPYFTILLLPGCLYNLSLFITIPCFLGAAIIYILRLNSLLIRHNRSFRITTPSNREKVATKRSYLFRLLPAVFILLIIAFSLFEKGIERDLTEMEPGAPFGRPSIFERNGPFLIDYGYPLIIDKDKLRDFYLTFSVRSDPPGTERPVLEIDFLKGYVHDSQAIQYVTRPFATYAFLYSDQPQLKSRLMRVYEHKIIRSPLKDEKGDILSSRGGWHRVEILSIGDLILAYVNGRLHSYLSHQVTSPGIFSLLPVTDKVWVRDLKVTTISPREVKGIVKKFRNMDLACFLKMVFLFLLLWWINAAVLAFVSRLPIRRGFRLNIKANAVILFYLLIYLVLRPHIPQLVFMGLLLFLIGVNAYLSIVILRSNRFCIRYSKAALGITLLFVIIYLEAGVSVLRPLDENIRLNWYNGIPPRYLPYLDPMVRMTNDFYNLHQFRLKNYPLIKGNGLRIAVMGGSSTWGSGEPIESETVFPSLLKKYLSRDLDTEKVEVLNAAFPGANTFSGLQFFKHVVSRYAPDIVLVNFAVNEGFNRGSLKRYLKYANRYITPSSSRMIPYKRSFFLASAAKAFQRLGSVLFHPRLRIMQENLSEFLRLSKEQGFRLILTYEPINEFTEKYEGEEDNKYYSGEYGVVRDFSKKHGVETIKTEEAFVLNREDFLFIDIMHLTRRGHRLMARTIADHLMENP